MDTSLPLDELKQKSLINERTIAADNSPAFSILIRQGMPGMGYMPEKEE